MKTLALETCDAPVRELVGLLGRNEAIVLTENGQPRYVLGTIDEFEWEVFSLSRNKEFTRYLEKARQRRGVEGTISIAEARRRLGLPTNT